MCLLAAVMQLGCNEHRQLPLSHNRAAWLCGYEQVAVSVLLDAACLARCKVRLSGAVAAAVAAAMP